MGEARQSSGFSYANMKLQRLHIISKILRGYLTLTCTPLVWLWSVMRIYLYRRHVDVEIFQVWASIPCVKTEKGGTWVLQKIIGKPHCRSSLKTAHLEVVKDVEARCSYKRKVYQFLEL